MKLKIRAKLFLGFTLVLLLMASAGGYLYFELKSITSSCDRLIDERAEKISLSKSMMATFSEEIIYLRNYLYTGENQYLQMYYNKGRDLRQLFEKFSAMSEETEGQKLVEAIKFNLNTCETQAVEATSIKMDNLQAGVDPKIVKENEEAINRVLERNTRAVRETLVALQAFVDLNQKSLDEGKLQNTKEVDRVLTLVVVMFLAALAAGLLVAFVMARNISAPITLLDREVGRIAGGDLSGRELAIKNKDEIGSLAVSFNKMLLNLKNMVGLVGGTARTLAGSSKELSAATQQTSAAASETASTIGQVSGAVQQVAGNAGEAAGASEAAAGYTVEGGERTVEK